MTSLIVNTCSILHHWCSTGCHSEYSGESLRLLIDMEPRIEGDWYV